MEFLTEPTKEGISKLGELAVKFTVKQFEYGIHHKKIIANLKEEDDKLEGVKEALQGWVDAKRRNREEIEPNIQKWLYEVETLKNVLRSFYEEKVKKNKECFGGKCPNLAYNYSLGKQAAKIIENITRLKEERNEFKLISHNKPPPTLGSTFTEDIKSLESRKVIISKVIEKLKDDKFKRISICGMGGVGKTTLVKELIKSVEGKLFDKVVMAVISQNPDYKNIQSQIGDCLGLSLKSESVEGRGRELIQKMKEIDDDGKIKVLVVLDDVWSELNFDLVGLPSRDNQKYSKILFTSRYEKVCLKMGSQENFLVSVLVEDEAWYLFQAMTGDVVYGSDIYPIAKQVAKECGGLPLAIVIVGKALENEKKLTTWEDAFEQLKNSQSSSFSDVHKLVYSRIELSFKFLGSIEHKKFLMLCGLFPEDFDIPIESLLRHAMGLGLFNDYGEPWKARNRVHSLVSDLKRCFLLLDSDVLGCVKMHDIVRDVVILVAFKIEYGFMVKYDIKRIKHEKLNDINAISLIFHETIKLEDNLECPALQLLQVMSKGNERNQWSEHLFQGMRKLKVFSMQNLFIPKLSFLSQASASLHTLQVEHCYVGDISIIGKELLHLEVLSFAHSNIQELPIEIGNLGVLRLLDLTNCNNLNVISSNVFIRLSRLEELYFRMKNFPWRKNEVAINELKKISHQLKIVEMKIWGTINLLKDMDFNNLQQFWIYVDPYTNSQRSTCLESNLLKVTDIDYQSINSTLMILHLIKKCEILSIRKVKGLKNVINQLFSDCPILSLKDLRVELCPNLEHLIDCVVHSTGFPQLQTLSLKNLKNLKEIFYSSNHHEVKGLIIEFSNLVKLELIDLPNFIGFNNAITLNELNQELDVAAEINDSTNTLDGEKLSRFYSKPHHCRSSHIIAKLFSSNGMKQYTKLETILLEDCISLEAVFDLEGYLKSSGEAQEWLFPQLTTIVISNLKHLLYVWGNVPYCIQGFQNLRFLNISNCNSLKYVFTSVIVRAITNLEKLEVGSCELIENIVVWSKGEEDDNKGHVESIGFNKLYYLSLSRLPKLVSICSNSLWLECPSLKKFDIGRCPMLDISFLPTHNDEKQDNLNATYSANTKDVDFQHFKQNNSRSSTWSRIYVPFISKFIHQGSTSKRKSKEASVAQTMHDDVPFIYEMKSGKGKSHMPALESLHIVKCDLLDLLFFLEEQCNFTVVSRMKTIEIEKCDNLKTIIAWREKTEDMINFFAILESLQLKNLPNLTRFGFIGTYESKDKQHFMDEHVGDQISIRHFPLIDEFLFPNLTSLLIEACNKINILFSHSSMSSLERLEKLEIRDCENMQEIISHQEDIDTSENKIMFRALRYLLLINLPNLKTFSQGHYNLHFPSLLTVDIENCPNIEMFSRGFSDTPKLENLTIEIESLRLENIYILKKNINAIIQGFKSFVASQGSKVLNWTKLYKEGYSIKKSEIYISKSHKLIMLVPYNEIQGFQHVKALDISYCDSLVEVFGSRGGAYTKKGEVVSFQYLTSIYVSDCHNLKSLLSHSMSRSLVQLQTLFVVDCNMMEVIVTKENEYIEGGNKVKTLFPKLEELILLILPKLECVCLGDYDYSIPLCNVGENKEIRNNDKIQISFPQLKTLELLRVPKLKCFCSSAYDYDIMVSSIEECSNMKTFPHGSVIVNTPNLDRLTWSDMDVSMDVYTRGDLNLTIYYLQNSEKYKVELQKLKTFRDMNEELHGYIKRVVKLDIENCHKLLSCIPSNMMHLFSHVVILCVIQCECLEEVFESNDNMMHNKLLKIQLLSLPKLKHIWKNHGQILGFKYLDEITIGRCNDLNNVFVDVSMATSLPNLTVIEVYECEKMEEIIGSNCVQAQQHEAKIIFPSLLIIRLKKLPSLKYLCRSSFPSYVELPYVHTISIEGCPLMKTFWDGGILYTPNINEIHVNYTESKSKKDVNEVILRHNK